MCAVFVCVSPRFWCGKRQWTGSGFERAVSVVVCTEAARSTSLAAHPPNMIPVAGCRDIRGPALPRTAAGRCLTHKALFLPTAGLCCGATFFASIRPPKATGSRDTGHYSFFVRPQERRAANPQPQVPSSHQRVVVRLGACGQAAAGTEIVPGQDRNMMAYKKVTSILPSPPSQALPIDYVS